MYTLFMTTIRIGNHVTESSTLTWKSADRIAPTSLQMSGDLGNAHVHQAVQTVCYTNKSTVFTCGMKPAGNP